MSWWGKVIGGAFGFMLGGPLGALFGAALGHNFDVGLARSRQSYETEVEFDARERTQTAFFTATFAVLGHVAKADGRVTPDEIRAASAVMDRLGLDPQLKHRPNREGLLSPIASPCPCPVPACTCAGAAASRGNTLGCCESRA